MAEEKQYIPIDHGENNAVNSNVLESLDASEEDVTIENDQYIPTDHGGKSNVVNSNVLESLDASEEDVTTKDEQYIPTDHGITVANEKQDSTSFMSKVIDPIKEVYDSQSYDRVMLYANDLDTSLADRILANETPEFREKIIAIRNATLSRFDKTASEYDKYIAFAEEERGIHIKYVDNLMERHGITDRDEAYLKILKSPTAQKFPEAPIVKYAMGMTIEEEAKASALSVANNFFSENAVEQSELKALKALTSTNIITKNIARYMLENDMDFSSISGVTTVDSFINPATWLANSPENLYNVQENISKRDWYEVTKEVHDELLDDDSVQISKAGYAEAKKDPDKAMNALTKQVVNEDGITETQYFYAPNTEHLKYDKEKKGYYYRAQEVEGLPLLGNLALTLIDLTPAGKLFKIGKKSFMLKQATINRYSKQAIQKRKDAIAIKELLLTTRKIADDNWKERQRYIEEFEERQTILLGRPVVIHTVVDGKKVIDPLLVRNEGLIIAEATHNKTVIKKVKEHMKLEEADMSLSELARPLDNLLLPNLNADKLDSLVAVGIAMRKANPKYFAKSDEVMANGKKKTLIDQLFEYTLEADVTKTDDFINTLADYGMSIDEFVMMTVGNVSEAGRLMQKVGQIRARRLGTQTKEALIENRKFEKGFKKFWSDWFLRSENIMRGALVTPLATAMRNASSVGIRMPAEVVINVMEEAVFAFHMGAKNTDNIIFKPFIASYQAGKKLNPLTDNSAWKNSFADVQALFNYQDSKRTMKYITDHPQLANLDSTLFGAVAELRKAMGRGQHSNPIANAADAVLTKAEDTVEFLNGFNKFQEFAVRRGVFLGQLRRLVKNEWKIDLDDHMFNKGNFQRILDDATVASDGVTKLRPEGARSIMQIIDDATYKALDVTYAKQPDFFLFRDASRLITRSGATVIPGLTFPRFMFNGLELMAKNTMGGTMPALRMITGNIRNAGDVRAVGENMVGWAAIYAMHQIVTAKEDDEGYLGEQPNDVTLLNVGAENPINIQGNFPLMQFKYVAMAIEASNNGTFSLFDPNLEQASKTFLGDAFRSGNTSMFVKDIRDILLTTEDVKNKKRASEVFGKWIGQWGSRLFTPTYQIADAQRLVGLKPVIRKDAKPPITEEQTLVSNIKRSFFQRWGSVEEKDYIDRVNLFKERGTNNKRVGLGSRLLFGISFEQGDGEEGNYIRGLGKRPWDWSSKLDDPTARNYQDQMLQNILPLYTKLAQVLEKRDNAMYEKRNDKYKEKYSKELSGKMAALDYLDNQVKKFKGMTVELSKTQMGVLGMQIMDYRNLPKTKQKFGLRKWYMQFDRDPDYTNLGDIQSLITLSTSKK
tara:strand:+ start:2083 stop:6111 length:4029 start_codon:yes stop_codon:yes gene_type:complete